MKLQKEMEVVSSYNHSFNTVADGNWTDKMTSQLYTDHVSTLEVQLPESWTGGKDQGFGLYPESQRVPLRVKWHNHNKFIAFTVLGMRVYPPQNEETELLLEEIRNLISFGFSYEVWTDVTNLVHDAGLFE